MTLHRCALSLASLVAFLGTAAASPLRAQDSIPGPSFEQTVSLRQAGSPVVSPDGRSIVYPVRSADWKANRFDTELWLARQGEAPFQLTNTPDGSSEAPAWSPDGAWIAFLAGRDGKQQVWAMRAEGGEALPVTQHEDAVQAFRWSPDGKRIAFRAQDPESKAHAERTEKLGDFSVEDHEYRQAHLWIVDVSPGSPVEARRLTEGDDFTVTSFEWSPDGRRIAFGRRGDPLINSWPSADIYLLDVATKAASPVVTAPGGDELELWSPDGKWILYRSNAGDTTSNYYANEQLYRVAPGGGGATRLAPDFDEDIGRLSWTRGGLYGIAWQGGDSRRLVRIDPSSGRATVLPGGPPVILSYDVSADGGTIALLGQTATSLPEIYRSPASRLDPTAVTTMTSQIEGWAVGKAEMISWKSGDGATIEGVLHTPPGFDPQRKYPLFVVIHGGPTGHDYPEPLTGYVYPTLQWLARGALILRPNYRGSAGYGAAFRALNVRNLGVGDAWDVLSGVDHLVAQGIVDTTRMGSMGWSEGGYISAFLTTTTRRFAAISVGAGISDWLTYYVNTDIHPFTRQYLKATPWDDPDIYRKTSPITYVRQATTPTLIQHDSGDPRVPVANAFELYQGLQDQGVPVRLIIYKADTHGIPRPKERLAALWHNWQWFEKWVYGTDVPVPGDAPVDQSR